MRREDQIGAEVAVFGAQRRENDRKPVAVVGVRVAVHESKRQAGAHVHACRIPAPRAPVVGDVVAAFVVAVEEGSDEKSVLRSDEDADADPVVVLPIVAFLEVIGKKARIDPYLDRLPGVRGAGTGEQSGEGESKQHAVLVLLSENCGLPAPPILYINTAWRRRLRKRSRLSCGGTRYGAAGHFPMPRRPRPPASTRSTASFPAAAG